MQTTLGRLLRILLVPLAAAAGVSTLAENGPAQPYRCEVKVIDINGKPIPGAAVEVYRGPDWRTPTDLTLRLESRTNTDANGAVAFSSTDRASLLFVVRKAGLSLGWNAWYPNWPGMGARDTTLEITLTLPTAISGMVQDAGGKPVPDAAVWAGSAFQPKSRGHSRQSYALLSSQLGRQLLTARTGKDGRFRIEGLPANATLDLTAAKAGLASESTSQALFAAGSLAFQAGQSDAVVTLGRAGAIEGKVVREDTGAPLAGVRVFKGEGQWQADLEPALTGSDGSFHLLDVYPGEYKLGAFVGTNQFADWICEPVPVTVEAGLTNRGVKIIGSRGAVLKVTVHDLSTGQPVKDASIWVSHEVTGLTARTSDQGIGWLRALPGDYQLGVVCEGYGSYQSQVTLERGQTNVLAIDLEIAPRLAGKVLSPDGRPAAKVTLSSFPASFPGEKQTDAEGRFTLVLDGNEFSGNGHTPRMLIASDPARNLAVALEVEPDTTNATLKLEPALTLAGRVTDAKGKAITNAEALMMFKTEHMSSSFGEPVLADAEGRFELKGLPAGRPYGVTVSAQGFGPQTRDVEIQEPGRPRVELEPFLLAVADRRIAGIVVDADDKPVAGASVNGHGDNQPYLNGRTDSKGRFSFAHVCAGQINLSANGARGSGFGGVTAEAGDTNIVIQLGVGHSFSGSGKLAKLAGSVLGPDGKPAAKVSVLLFPVHGVERQSDAEGRFKLSYSAEQYAMHEPLVLVARDPAHNLAATFEVEAGVTNASLKLEPGLTLAGRITDAQDKTITNGEVQLTFWTEHMGSTIGQPVRADAQGRFEIKGLPSGRRYELKVSAKGFSQADRNVEATETETRRLELEAFRLAAADQRVAGVVMDADDKPVSGASISISGEKQPNLNGRSDAKGRFAIDHIATGQVQISAYNTRGGYGSVVADAGDTNVIVQMGVSQSLGGSRAMSRVGGTIVDADGKPAPKATISLIPFNNAEKQSDALGRFKLVFNPNEWGGSPETVHILVARDMVRNLAATLEVEPGTTNAELKLEPGLTLAGRVTGPNGQAIPGVQVQVMFVTDRMSSSFGAAVRGNAQGQFEIKALPPGSRYTVDISAKGFSRESRKVEPKDNQTGRMELEPFQLAVADQRVAGKVVDADDQPVAGAWVNLYGDKQTSANSRSDAKGQFAFNQLSAGEVRLAANHPHGGGFGNINVEAGDTNVTLQIGVGQSFGGSGKPSRLSGAVVDIEGKPAPKVRVNLFPFHDTEKQTDAAGHFKLTFNPREWSGSQDTAHILIARDFVRNLATALEVEHDATNADLKLEKGFTLVGRVTDTNGNPIPHAEAALMFHVGRMGSSLGTAVRADAEGRFEIKALPPGCHYGVSVSAKGFGQESQNVEPAQAETSRLELEPFQLIIADQPLAGEVLDSEDNPVAEAWVSAYGAKQPSLSGRSDSKGHFAFARVCAGPLQLSVNGQHGGYASVNAEGGDTNVTVRLSASSGIRPAAPRRASLKGKPLPDLSPLGLTPADAPAGQPILAVLIDAEQRPSRHAVKVLGEQAEALKQKRVAVVLLQAGAMSEEAFAAWKQEAPPGFAIGRFKQEAETARAAWGAGTFPWLILTDGTRRVAAEGFAVEDLETRLKAVEK